MDRRVSVWIERLEDRRLLAGMTPLGDSVLRADAIVSDAPLTIQTTTSLELSASSAGYGQEVVLTATVIAAGPLPVGNVRFMDGDVEILRAPLNPQGRAAITLSDLAIGVHRIQAIYDGEAAWTPSSSDAAPLAIYRGTTKTTLQTSGKSLPEGQELTLTATVVEASKGWTDATGRVVFKEGSRVLGYGKINRSKASLTLSALAPGTHLITATFAGDGNYTASKSLPLAQTITRATVVDLMAIYTSSAAKQVGSGQAAYEEIVQAVRDTNLAMANSRVPVSIRLVYAGATRYAESGAFDTDLDRLATPGDGYMDDVPRLRDQYGADLVTLLEGDGDLGGLAYTLQRPRARGNDDLGFSVVLIGQAAGPTYTLAHELGHNFGAVHDLENADDGGAYRYSYGYRFWADGTQYRDIMAYDPGQVIPYYANPDVIYHGVPTGTKDSSDVARTIRQTAGVVAGYRDRVVAGTVGTRTQVTGPTEPPLLGQIVSFTATVSVRAPEDGVPAGRIEFLDGNRSLGSVLLSGGLATLRTKKLAPGSHSITAVYSGDWNFGASRSGVVRFSVVIKARARA